MNLLGKIFTVLIFVISVVFMSLALMVFATHINWKLVATNSTPAPGKPLGLQQQLEQSRTEIERLKKEIEEHKTRYTAEMAARAYALAALQSKLVQVEEQLKGKEADLTSALANLTAQTAALATSSATQEAIQGELGKLRVEIQVAQLDRDTMFDKTVSMVDDLHKSLGMERALKERQGQLQTQVTSLMYTARLYGWDLNLVSLEAPPPQLDGIVLAVQKDLLEISIGSDDGLKAGHTLEVFRGSRYLGKMIVSEVRPNRSVGSILIEYRKGPIQKDDRVATRFNKLG